MTTATQDVQKEAAPLFGKKEKKVLVDPFWDNNPITLQVLGICSALAITSQLRPTLVMCVALTTVVAGSNVVISMIRNYIPSKIRIIVMLAVVSTLVTLVDQLLKAYSFDMSKKLSVFVGLIITNCIVLGRAEAFAMANKPWPSLLDGIGNGLGYSIILVLVATCREILGAGKLLGFQIIPESMYQAGYVDFGLMILPPGAFIFLGLIIWVQKQSSKQFEV
ncbi:MAG: NADH:ubiquinone reductase (Na(+)-transporting) subunit D [Acidobacteria bacterium]|nr:NADH:ubiquinone reductase (Na(+)-transporting) subunit D [Acidobacteriota bacterium]